MLYSKADEYIFKIYSNEENETKLIEKFNLFIPNQKTLKRIGGKIYNDNGQIEDCYFVSKNDNSLGIKIGNGKYIYSQKRTKFIEAPEFEELISEDDYMSEDEFKASFKDVEFVEIFEKDEEKGVTTNVSFLVNGTSYLLLNYFAIYGNYDNISAEFLPLCSKVLKKYNFDQQIENEEKRNEIRNKLNAMIIPAKHQALFDINNNNSAITSMNFRIKLLEKVYSEILEADKKYFKLQDDSELCFKSVSASLKKKFGNQELDER